MSIEVLRIIANKFEENGVQFVDSHKVGELISRMDDTLEPQVFRPLIYDLEKGLNNNFIKVWNDAMRNNVKTK